MKQNLKDCIEKWKKGTESGQFRSVKSDKNKVINGEYALTLKMVVKVNFMTKSEQVSLTRKVNTAQQASELRNPEGDIDNFNKTAKQLENDFKIKVDETITKLWKSQTPDGFI